MFFPYIFTEWHIVPLLYIQLKLERACSRKTLAEGKASRRLGKYIGGFVCFCESPDIISCISSIRIRFLIRVDAARGKGLCLEDMSITPRKNRSCFTATAVQKTYYLLLFHKNSSRGLISPPTHYSGWALTPSHLW